MSYILDALKKAERERGVTRVPTLMTVHDLRAMPKNRLWVIAGIVVVFAAVSLWYLTHSRTVPVPSRTVSFGTEEGERRANQAETKETVAPSPLATQESPLSRKASISASAPQPPLADSKRSSGLNLRSGLAAGSSDTTDSPLPASPTQTTPGTSNVGAKEVAPASPNNQVKPVPLREAVARMNMSVLAYAENKAERMVFINGRKYAEGDYIDGQYLLESITPEGAVLTYEGEQAVLRPGPK